MKNVIRSVKAVCMWIALIVIGTSVVEFVLSKSVWYLGLMFMDPLKALSYLVFASIILIGVFNFIDNVREKWVDGE